MTNAELTTQELEAIRKRSEQATEGPWELTNTGIGVTGMPRKEVLWATISEDIYGNKADVEFVLSARTDIPKLLAEVDRLRAVLTQIDELSDDFYNIESIDGVPTFVLRPDLEDYRDTIHEITVLPYEAINGGD